MPAWLRVVAHANPLTYEVQGLRQMLVGVGGAGVLWLDFAVVAGFFAAMLGGRHARLSEGDPVNDSPRSAKAIPGAPTAKPEPEEGAADDQAVMSAEPRGSTRRGHGHRAPAAEELPFAGADGAGQRLPRARASPTR